MKNLLFYVVTIFLFSEFIIAQGSEVQLGDSLKLNTDTVIISNNSKEKTTEEKNKLSVKEINTDENEYKSIIIDGKKAKYKESNNVKIIVYE